MRNDICIPQYCRNTGIMCGICERKAQIGGTGVSYGMMLQDLYYRHPRIKTISHGTRPGCMPFTLEVIFGEGKIAIYDYKTKTLEKKKCLKNLDGKSREKNAKKQ